jgi:uncharacterized protein (DUF2249 family)/quercetin dioxygenase-like cupin family protein
MRTIFLSKKEHSYESMNILENVAFNQDKPALRTLLPGPGPRVMLLCLRAGQMLPEHATSDAVIVQALSGWTTFYEGPSPFEMNNGMLIRVEAGTPHSLTARQDSVLLVTVLAPLARREETPSFESLLLDLRGIPRGQRHPLVFSHLEKLAVGESFTIVNDHDPQPRRKQLEMHFPSESTWNYLERGPEVFRIRINRVGLPIESTEPRTLVSCALS